MNRTPVLFLNVLLIAMCGLVYELLAGTLASYVLGDSITQFSFIIGFYLFALGIGAWLSRFVDTGLARVFVEVELAVALIGGLSAALLYLSFAYLRFFHIVLYGMVLSIGILVGLELPLLMRILKDHLDFKDLVSRVLAFDYVGALIASLLFPIFCVPQLGLVRTALVFGMLNAAVGLWATWLLRPLLRGRLVELRARGVLVLVILVVGFIKADFLTSLAEDNLFHDPIVYAESSPYQRIVLTRGREGFQLHLNGHLQFSSMDEYRYHEALVHPAMVLAGAPRRVLVLGGGDGLALREIFKHPSVETVTLVDIDPAMTGLSYRYPPLAELNRHAFDDPRLEVVNQDAMIWLENSGPPYDTVIIDFPDPNNYSLGKLYTTRFYRMLQRRMTPASTLAIQCTSPLAARKTFWCIARTLEAAGFQVRPYHTSLPSFGIWGFCLAQRTPFEIPARLPESVERRYLTDQVLATLFVFPLDLGPVPVEINRLDNQVLVRYHETEWGRWE